MIAAYFPQPVRLTSDDGGVCRLRGYDPQAEGAGSGWDLARIYLLLDETLEGASRDCRKLGLTPPVPVQSDFLARIPGWPVALGDFLGRGEQNAKDGLKVALLNGGGGGLGDGIMFGPALEILARRLADQVGGRIVLDVYSSLPVRTHAVLRGIPSVRVRTLPVSLHDFFQYDAQLDFSGMLHDDLYLSAHMTDFVLARMGIDPQTVADLEKEPVLRLGRRPDPLLTMALEQARREARGKRMVAVIFQSARVRTMPEERAADLLRFLGNDYQPVIIMPPHGDSRLFLQTYGLGEAVVDLSRFSRDFAAYMGLLAGMDAIVSVDTSAVHIGGALGKPTVGIFNSIAMEQRIRYSPTVVGIQLAYRGKGCAAPCGRSKGAAFIEGNVPGRGAVRLEFGYACDEAVDKEALLKEVACELARIDPAADVDGQLNRIHASFRERFIRHSPPCWDGLRSEKVGAALTEAFGLAERFYPSFACPVCGHGESHLPCDRREQRMRFACRICGADFFANLAESAEIDMAAGGLFLPDKAQCDRFAMLLALARQERCLIVETAIADWDDRWCPADLAAKADRLAVTDTPPARQHEYDCIIAPGVLDLLPAPGALFAGLVRALNEDGLLFLVTMNRHCLAEEVADRTGLAKSYLPGPGWHPEALEGMCRKLGCRLHWCGVSSLSWPEVTGALGTMAPLTICPPDLDKVRIQLSGEELSLPVQRYLKPALETIDRGRYCFAVVGKGTQA